MKVAHPGLRDADIDRIEELTTRRARMLPEHDADAIANLDHEISELLQTRMPHFDKVVREYAAMLHAERASRVSPPVEVKPKR